MPDYSWPVIPARWFTKTPAGTRRHVRLIVIHDMEAPETVHTAEDVAHYFATTDTKASAHVCVDNNSTVQCVYDNDVAYAAPGANHDGIQMELAGYGRQTKDEWLDPYGIGLLAEASRTAAYYTRKYSVPIVRLTNDQLLAGDVGFVGHHQVSEVYHKSDHTDPGPNFPWAEFLGMVGHAALRPAA
jgi:N-acetyl-anhydromuramyl-L-alanine amidase AmpD